MLTILLCLLAGMILGFLLRQRQQLIRLTDTLTSYVIYAFLALLGIGVGTNEMIMRHLGQLGVQAFVLTLGGILGSVVVAYFVERIFFADFKKRNDPEP